MKLGSTAMFTILFRCDGGPTIGLGHVIRCLALAEELTAHRRCHVEFAVAGGGVAVRMISEAGYRVHRPPRQRAATGEAAWLHAVMARSGAQLIVCDVREGLDLPALQLLRKAGVGIVVLDDSSDRRLAADLAFYPPTAQFPRLDWRGFPGRAFGGWQWTVLRRQFQACRTQTADGPPLILLSSGGADPAGITPRLVDALDLVEAPIDPVLVLGPAHVQSEERSRRLRAARRPYRILSHVTDMAGLMAQARLAVISFGMTAYELAALGVPAIYVALSEDHAESAATFQRAGMGINLGEYRQVGPHDIAAAVRQLLADPARLAAMSARGRSHIDGRGAERVARQIIRYLRNTHERTLRVA